MKTKRKSNFTSPRLPGFDYATPGPYFITICTKNRIRHFGEITAGTMHLSDAGKIAKSEWLRTKLMWKRVFFDEWVIMPDHIHAIVWFDFDKHPFAPHYQELPQTPGYKAQMIMVSGNLSSLVRGFKGAVTRAIRKKEIPEFAWQGSFYDRIIRNQNELKAFRKYIWENPSRWKEDSQ